MKSIIETANLGKCYGVRRALQDCTMSIPEGKIVGLVGPNGAGKSTFLKLAAGVLAPDSGTIRVNGEVPGSSTQQLNDVGYVGQDTPVYKRMSVGDHLRMSEWLNPRWDVAAAKQHLHDVGLNFKQRAGSLSGGQRAQLALTLATAKTPQLLLLDEPVASLDPLARREFLQTLMSTFAASPMSIVLSSHLIDELERICDYLIILIDSQVQLIGDVSDILETHFRLSGARRDIGTLPLSQEVITESYTDRQTTAIIRSTEPIFDPHWIVTPVTLEDVTLAYMKRAANKQSSTTVAPLGVVK